jgi:hypothetical protein
MRSFYQKSLKCRVVNVTSSLDDEISTKVFDNTTEKSPQSACECLGKRLSMFTKTEKNRNLMIPSFCHLGSLKNSWHALLLQNDIPKPSIIHEMNMKNNINISI